nr:unnamed protein product [Callosobruchus analis]
MHLHIPADL